jgi:ankyrin repeat protein
MPEEAFVPGLDPKLREWILMQRELKEARLKALARAQLNVPSYIKYSYHNFWKNQLQKQLLPGEGSTSRANSTNRVDADEDENMPLGGRALSVQAFTRILENPESTPAKILQVAIERRHTKFLEMALSMGVPVDFVLDSHGRTALHLTVLDSDAEKVSCLLEHGANVNAKDEMGNTPLILSIKHSVLEPLLLHREVTTTLIRHGADLNAVDKHGYTALHR